MRRIRTYHEVEATGAELLDQVVAQRRRLDDRLARVRHVVAVASGKGGVGKSLVTANLAAALARSGRRVGAADADLNGPSLARMLGAAATPLEVDAAGVQPARGAAGVRVISMDLLLAGGDAPVRWREPAEGGFIWQSTLETGALREFLADVAWGELDYLFIDMPPGSDKLGRLLQLVPGLAGVLLVTIPSEMARAVVARSARLLKDAGLERIGLVANMTSHVCAGCGRVEPLFSADGARRLAAAAGLPLWAEIPFDPRLAELTDAGRPPLEHGASAAAALEALAERVEGELGGRDPEPPASAAVPEGVSP